MLEYTVGDEVKFFKEGSLLSIPTYGVVIRVTPKNCHVRVSGTDEVRMVAKSKLNFD